MIRKVFHNALTRIVLGGLLICITAESAPEDLLLSPQNVSLLKDQLKVLQSSSVVILDADNLSRGYGILVSSDGQILTKASLLNSIENYTIRLGKKKYTPKVLRESKEWDLALLKIPIENALPVEFSEKILQTGDIILSNGATSILKRRLKFGVISAKERSIPMNDATLDFIANFDTKKSSFIIESLKEGGSSQKAGLKAGDLLLSIDEMTLNAHEHSSINLFQGKWPGDIANLSVKRKKKEIRFKVPYQWRFKVFPSPMDRNEAMSGRISGRKTGFPKVFQHDIALSSRSIGGPVIDLDGKCVGMNIARFNRAETYAIPASALKKLLADWNKGSNK